VEDPIAQVETLKANEEQHLLARYNQLPFEMEQPQSSFLQHWLP